MPDITSLLLFPVLLIIIAAIVFPVFMAKGQAGIKVMLLGIQLTLIGGVFAADPNSNLGGFEYLIVFIGLVVSILGLMKNDQ